MSAIDPGISESIGQAAPRVDTSHVDGELYQQGEGKAFLQHEENFLNPSRWWFASTAFPLLAGTFGPIANSFNICALASEWRFKLSPGFITVDDTGVPDPTWLLALNGVSLAFALISNTSLLLNMSQRVSFAIAQPITVVGFFLAGLILAVLVGICGSNNWAGLPAHEFSLGGAYYYGCFAAGLYIMISILMAVTVYGAWKGHYSKDFQLTNSQRTLMLQTIVFMFYLLIGALIYQHLEGWNFLDAVYWADFTLLTIGIGDYYVPKTTVGRGLIIPFAVGGIVTLGLVVGSIRSMMLEAASEKLGARSSEKKREAVLKTMDYDKGTYKIDWYRLRRFDPNATEWEVRKQEFYAMRDVLERADRNRAWRGLAISFGAFIVLWFGGAAVFWRTEQYQHWTYFESLYFSYIILLTIGYGDFEAKSYAGRAFFVFWSLLAVPALTVLISDLGDTVVKQIVDATNWIANITVLPGEGGIMGTLKSAVRSITKGIKYDAKDFVTKQPGNFLPKTPAQLKHNYTGTTAIVMDRLNDAEVLSAERAGLGQETKLKDRRFYNYLLLREIRKVLVDSNQDSSKQYTYEEWAFYLKLLGLDESETHNHAKPFPPIVPETKPDGSPETFNLARDIDDDGIVQPWSWLGVRSPLMSGKPEPEWILHRLIIRLQRELHLDSYNEGSSFIDPPLKLSVIRQETHTSPGDEASSSSNDAKKDK